LIAAKELPANAAVVDIGSGGGSPAIPLKIAAPGISMTMVESKARKAAFLREAVRHLRLERASVLTARLEAVAEASRLAGSADVVSIRAVRTDARTLQIVARLLRSSGKALLFCTASDATPSIATLTADGRYPLVPGINSELIILRRS